MIVQRKVSLVILLIAMQAASPGMGGHANAAGAIPACEDLTIGLSNDKSRYVFTASSTISSNAIVGYKFDFGDYKSYDVMFDTDHKADRSKVVATHAYEKAGSYTASASILLMQHGTVTSVSSPECQARVTVRNKPTADLSDAGPGNVASLFLATVIASSIAHYFWHRRTITEDN